MKQFFLEIHKLIHRIYICTKWHVSRLKNRINAIDKTLKVKVILPLVLLIIGIFFKEPLELLFVNVFVKPIFSLIKISAFKDSAVLLLFLASYGWLAWEIFNKKKEKRQLDYLRIYYFINICLVYCYYRFPNESPFEFISLHYIPSLAYADVVVLSLIGIFVRFLPRVKNLGLSSSQFIEDQPKTFISRDIFHRSFLINQVFVNTSGLNTDKSFAIGLQGEWGSGKSFVLNSIKSRLINDGNPDNLVLEFNPWKYHNPKELVSAFFQDLIKKIGRYNPDLSDQLQKYSKILLVIDDNILTKSVNNILEVFFPKLTISELYEAITNTLRTKVQKRIHVFIDDIDRLDSDEVFEVLRLIRNTANFPNFIYYVAFDKDYIANVIKISNKGKNEEYLDKIFQLLITIPKLNPEMLFVELKNLLRNNRADSEFANIDLALNQLKNLTIRQGENPVTIRTHDVLKAEFKTPRDIIRFANLVNLELPLVYGQVDMLEFLLLLILKLKHFDIYSLIKSEIGLTIVDETQNDSYNIDFSILENHGTTVDKNVKFILEYLYSDERHRIMTISIKYIRNHMQYFAYDSFDRITHMQLTSLKSKIVLNKNRAKIKQSISALDEADFIGILLNSKSFIDKNDYKRTVELYRLSYYTVSQNFKPPLYQGLLQLLRISDQLKDNLFEAKIHLFNSFVKSFFTNAEYPALLESALALDLLKLALYDTEGNPPLSINVLKKNILNYFEKYLQSEPLSIITFELFYKNYDTVDSTTNKVTLNEKACRLMKIKILENDENKQFYANNLIVAWGGIVSDAKMYFLDPFVFDIFGGEPEFEKYLFALPENITNLELQSFYRRYKNNNFKPTEFERNFIEIISDSDTEFVGSPTFPMLVTGKAFIFTYPTSHFSNQVDEIEPLNKYYYLISHRNPTSIDENEPAIVGEYFFRRNFLIPESYVVVKAELFFAAVDTCEISINDVKIKQSKSNTNNSLLDIGKSIMIRQAIHPGVNNLNLKVIKMKSSSEDNTTDIQQSNPSILPYGLMYALRIQLKSV